ncbi:hypothetical protein AKO1_006112, partial [Acrasis kona]
MDDLQDEIDESPNDEDAHTTESNENDNKKESKHKKDYRHQLLLFMRREQRRRMQQQEDENRWNDVISKLKKYQAITIQLLSLFPNHSPPSQDRPDDLQSATQHLINNEQERRKIDFLMELTMYTNIINKLYKQSGFYQQQQEEEDLANRIDLHEKSDYLNLKHQYRAIGRKGDGN